MDAATVAFRNPRLAAQKSACHFRNQLFAAVTPRPESAPFTLAAADAFPVQPGFVARGVAQFVEEHAVIVLACLEGMRLWHFNKVQRWRIASAVATVRDCWTFRHVFNNALRCFN